jgi:hypothetical protein
MSIRDPLDLGHPVLHLIGKSEIGKPLHDKQQANQAKQELHWADNPSSGMNLHTGSGIGIQAVGCRLPSLRPLKREYGK